jgi:hypothetical protein
VNAAAPSPRPKAAPEQALPPQPPPVATAQLPLEPTSAGSTPASAAPMAQPEAPAASAVAAAQAKETAPPRTTPAPAHATNSPKPATRSSAPNRSSAVTGAASGEPPVNEAERRRVLEWLTKRGPSPRPDMKLPPPPEAGPASPVTPAKAEQPS